MVCHKIYNGTCVWLRQFAWLHRKTLHWLFEPIHYQVIYTKPIHHIMFYEMRYLVEHPSSWSILQLHTMGCSKSITLTYNENVKCKFTRHDSRTMIDGGPQIISVFDSYWQKNPFDPLSPKQNEWPFTDDIFKCILLKENFSVFIFKCHKNLFLSLTIYQHWYR